MAKHSSQKSKKRIMRSLKVNEISGVDRPAQAGALALIMKRAPEENETLEYIEKVMRLTSSEKGHSHLIDDSESSGRTSWEKSEDEEFGHDHPFVMNTDGSGVTIGDAEGHGHGLIATKVAVDKAQYEAEQEERMAVDKAAQNKSAGQSGGGQEPHVEDFEMTEAEKAAAKKVEAAEKARVDKLEADLQKSEAYGKLTDLQKAHYESLGETEQGDFLKKKPEEREAVLAKASETDTVVYTDSDGAEYRKSDDPRTVASAKRADAAIKVAHKAEERANNADLSKRADVLLKHLPGDEDVKVAVLKAVDGIADEAVRTKALDMLKVNGEKLAEAFVQKGTQSAGTVRKADDQLEAMAKKYAEDHKVDIIKARVAVLETPEGVALYNETLNPVRATA